MSHPRHKEEEGNDKLVILLFLITFGIIFVPLMIYTVPRFFVCEKHLSEYKIWDFKVIEDGDLMICSAWNGTHYNNLSSIDKIDAYFKPEYRRTCRLMGKRN